MSDAALQSNSDCVSIDGLTDLFESQEQIEFTLHDASRLLKVPYTTLFRQIRRGMFEIVKSSDGSAKVILSRQRIEAAHNRAASATAEVSMPAELLSEHEAHTELKGENYSELMILLADQMKELQHASYRNGYLEALVESQERQLKLLPDLQSQSAECHQLKMKIETQESTIADLRSQLERASKKWWQKLFRH